MEQLMNEYPISDDDFEQMFKTEKDCLEYIILVRWLNDPQCPKC
ncbi:MAG: transposase [Rickettsiales bacterium]|jgi:hypothetical protein|nr:transposase [Rickettsiales bacterium]